MVLPWVALVLWAVGLYGVFAKSVFLLPCLVFVALTPFRWVTSCPTGDIAAGARALWGGMVANILAIVFVCSCQFFLAVGRANDLATGKLDDAFMGLRKAFDAYWNHDDATGPMGSVSGDCGAGKGFCASAAIEPRMWRNAGRLDCTWTLRHMWRRSDLTFSCYGSPRQVQMESQMESSKRLRVRPASIQ